MANGFTVNVLQLAAAHNALLAAAAAQVTQMTAAISVGLAQGGLIPLESIAQIKTLNQTTLDASKLVQTDLTHLDHLNEVISGSQVNFLKHELQPVEQDLHTGQFDTVK